MLCTIVVIPDSRQSRDCRDDPGNPGISIWIPGSAGMVGTGPLGKDVSGWEKPPTRRRLAADQTKINKFSFWRRKLSTIFKSYFLCPVWAATLAERTCMARTLRGSTVFYGSWHRKLTPILFLRFFITLTPFFFILFLPTYKLFSIIFVLLFPL